MEKNIRAKINLEGEILGYKKKVLLCTVVLLLTAGLFFYAGAKYEKYKLSSHGLLKYASGDMTFKGFLTAKDENSFTFRLEDGTEKTIPINEFVIFGSKGKDRADDFLVGHLLVVSGKSNPDGTFITNHIRKSKNSPEIEKPQSEAPVSN